MDTTAALTKTAFKPLASDNEKLTALHKQIDVMGTDFEDMKRTREEAKKQLEAKFLDVYRKIQNTKEFVVSEGKRINDTLLAFQAKFEMELKTTAKNFQAQHDKSMAEVAEKFQKVNERLVQLDKAIEQEREDRLRQTDENLRPIRQALVGLQESYETEKKDRIAGEKMILQKLDDEAYELNEKLKKETDERLVKQKEMRDEFQYELRRQEKFNENFHQKTIDEFNHVANNLTKEMDNRFEHQDKIVDNLSNVIKTIQATLRVMGSDV